MAIVYLSGNPVHDLVLTAFHDGMPSATIRNVTDYEPSEIAVVFGVGKKAIAASYHRGRIIEKQRAQGLKVIILETGYVRRGDGPEDYYAAGFDGLNGHADFRNRNCPPGRWNDLDMELKPWRKPTESGHILLIGQVPWDASVQHIDMPGWLEQQVIEIRRHTKRDIVYRPHPKGPVPKRLAGAYTSTATLEHDLEHASAVVTYNSNCGVDAVIAGVPAWARGTGSMIGPVNQLYELNTLDYPDFPDRVQWACNLAYTQWTPAEMRRGLTWNHLMGEFAPDRET